jgi:flagellar hook-basal body complex protein FliE
VIAPIGGLGAGLSTVAGETVTQAGTGAVQGAAQGGQGAQAGAAESVDGGFGGELTEAISSLEKTQHSASAASQALATGNVKDPESAVVTVEDAVMAMDLASQVRGKLTEAAQTIFQTQV